MCEFFSCLAFRDGAVRFCEDDSHETLISRLALDDTQALPLRSWVRVEVSPVGERWGPVCVDEESTPGWWDEDRAAFEGRVLTVATRVRPAWAVYNAAVRSAWAVYNAAVRSARAVYNAAVQPAWAVYDAAVRSAWAAYREQIQPIEGYV
jgi:hypothetical protein